jgi:hypothetical protein
MILTNSSLIKFKTKLKLFKSISKNSESDNDLSMDKPAFDETLNNDLSMDKPAFDETLNTKPTKCTNIRISNICIYIWLVSSLGLPILVPIYINKLASTVNIKCLGVSGSIICDDNSLSQSDIDSLSLGQREFINDVQTSWVIHWFALMGPFSIPISLYYGTKSTIDYFRFRLSKNKINKCS